MQKDMHLATVSAYESGVAIPVTNVAKEIYRLAMRGGHDAEDFSVVYEYLSSASDSAIVDQTSSPPAKAELLQAR
jgi:3-hydroxyisobutyrate dehydrogenase/glyoxylate/succinic semialdehyde reductase